MSDRMKHGAPLYEALLRYKRAGNASFHVPGHKNGQAYQMRADQTDGHVPLELAPVMGIDVTEISGMDDLHQPEGVIKEAQEQAALLFGAEETYFLVGGSTAGNLALILSVCTAPGDVLLVQRNVHKSVIHGLMLARARAGFLAPQLHGASGLATIPSVETVREALRRYPGAKGLLITHPNYYGMGGALAELAELCHAHGVPLLVDEAHGAHYGLHPALPGSALSQGADGVVQSTHKMLAALTMGAMLHVQGRLLDRGLLRQRLAMVQSSSPSYPIMASLDLSRSLLQQEGPAAFEEGLTAAEWLRQSIESRLPRFGIVKAGASGEDAAYTVQDPFKLVLYDAAGEWSGYELQAMLESAGCVPEMSDDRYVVLAMSLGTTKEDVERLFNALEALSGQAWDWNGQQQEKQRNMQGRQRGQGIQGVVHHEVKEESEESEQSEQGRRVEQDEQDEHKEQSNQSRQGGQGERPRRKKLVDGHQEHQEHQGQQQQKQKHQQHKERLTGTPAVSVSTWNIESASADAVSELVPFDLQPTLREQTEAVFVEDSQGRTAAEMIIPYPPGIPLLYPGEVISERTMNRLKGLRQAGAKCQGAADTQLTTILVYKHLYYEQKESGSTDEK